MLSHSCELHASAPLLQLKDGRFQIFRRRGCVARRVGLHVVYDVGNVFGEEASELSVVCIERDPLVERAWHTCARCGGRTRLPRLAQGVCVLRRTTTARPGYGRRLSECGLGQRRAGGAPPSAARSPPCSPPCVRDMAGMGVGVRMVCVVGGGGCCCPECVGGWWY